MADEKRFKSSNRPASCTLPPWASLIQAGHRDEVLRQIKKESIELHGQSLDECPKRKVCFGKTCLGRPLPLLSPTAKPYLDLMKQNQKTNSSGELILTNCDLCSIAKQCTSTCAQVNDYMNRDKNEEPDLIYREGLENIVQEEYSDIISRVIGSNIKVPWDSINKLRQDVIKKYLYDQKDFLIIAKELDLQDQARAKYEFYAGLTTLSEVGAFRAFLQEKGEGLTKKQKDVILMLYVANVNMVQAAKALEISKQAVAQIVSRVTKNYGIKWKVFVRKEKNKLIYQVPELLK